MWQLDCTLVFELEEESPRVETGQGDWAHFFGLDVGFRGAGDDVVKRDEAPVLGDRACFSKWEVPYS